MRKVIAFILSFFTVFLSGTMTVWAAEIKNETVTVSLTEYQNYKPDTEKEIDGKKYIFKNFSIQAENPATFEITADNLKSKDYQADQRATNPNNSNQTGELQNVEYKEVINQNRKTNVSKDVSYAAVPLNYDIPKTFSSEYYDKETDSTITSDLQLSVINKSKTYWNKADNLTGVVSGYDGLNYSLKNSNISIPKNEEKPLYIGYEKDILKSLNLNPENYRIIDSSWTSSSYINSNGLLCRNCSYSVEALVCDITAKYESEIQLPDAISYTATATYLDNDSSTYTLNLVYEKAPISKTVIALSVVIGILIISALIAAILIFLSKRKKSDEQLRQHQGPVNY